MIQVLPNPPMMRIEKQWQNAEWSVICRNVHTSPVHATTKVTWYKVIHDILPTRARLHKIRPAAALYERCDREDTVKHRLTECNRGLDMWTWTCQRIAMILRTDWRRISSDWLLRPDCQLWPPKLHRAVLWILANFVAFCLQTGRTQTIRDYYDYLCRTRWNLEHHGLQSRSVGNYLSVITLDAR
jgi:hypothetical protein